MDCQGGCWPADEAAYWCHMPIGNVVPLCVRCCAIWRRLAAEAPEGSLDRLCRVESIR